MNEKVQKTITTVKEFWGGQSKKNKGIYIGGLVIVILIAVVVAILLNRKDYVTLYEGLEATEAAEIVSLIEGSGYECTLSSGGTITVLKGTENAIAMNLAMQKYPKSQLTYDVYTTNVGMFTTESEKREYERMAAEERLSAVLGSFAGVRSATVTLSVPEQKNTVIAAYQQEPSASAVIYVEDNVTLSNEQIEGMTYFIVSSAGIKEENITLVDNNGALLISSDTPADVVAEETKKLKFKTDLEEQIRTKINNLLIPAYGEDGFSAAVNMVLNFDSKVSENTLYSPSTEDERGMLQHTDASQASGSAVAEGGVVGVETNADDTFPTGDTANNGQWSENSVSNTYLVNTYKEQIEKAGYIIDGLSISVVIYTDYLPDTTRQELVNLVANAGTVNPEVAQDVVSVTNLQKYSEALPAEAQQTFLFGLTLNQLVILGAILLGILLILIIVLVSLSSKAKKKRKTFEKTLLEQHATDEDEPLVESFFTLENINSPIEIPSLLDNVNADTKEVVIRRELGKFASHSPEIVAQLLRSWMREDEEEIK